MACFPSTAVLERGCAVHEAAEFLASMDQATFDAFAGQHVRYCQMAHKSVFWVPYGWHVVSLVSHAVDVGPQAASEQVSSMLCQPYLAGKLVSLCPNIAASMASAVLQVSLVVQQGQDDVEWATRNVHLWQHAKDYLHWLQQVSRIEALQALDDGEQDTPPAAS